MQEEKRKSEEFEKEKLEDLLKMKSETLNNSEDCFKKFDDMIDALIEQGNHYSKKDSLKIIKKYEELHKIVQKYSDSREAVLNRIKKYQ